MASELTQDELQPLPPELHLSVEHLVTEDDSPVDNAFAEKQQRLLTEPLYSSWKNADPQRRFVAFSNVGLFYAIDQSPLVPDILLSLDVELPQNLWPKSHRSYFLWKYGKPPDVVIEVVSNREGGEDQEKLLRYARIGVPYYVIFDPERTLGADQLRIYRKEAMRYHQADDSSVFPEIGLGVRIWHGSYEGHEDTWLRWVDAEGELILSGAERAELLAEQLRRLGVEPEHKGRR